MQPHFPKVERQQAEHALASTTGDVVTPPTIAPRPCIAPSPVIVTTVSGRLTSCTPQAPWVKVPLSHKLRLAPRVASTIATCRRVQEAIRKTEGCSSQVNDRASIQGAKAQAAPQKMHPQLATTIGLRSTMTLSLHNRHLINGTFFRRLQDEDELRESTRMLSVEATLRRLPPLTRPHRATANLAALRRFLPLISPPRPPQPLRLSPLTSLSKS
uniref:Uncharacterized protein n=1 Tax=Oryza sativa subsp. japonica TaxID=39947 RepID=Q6YWE8_ORYSJ|nr:hypothetical protein [Oryza sativa Japonica Group]BAD16393.1 hypothetical protein [Oryza sativa Japonica Group]